MHQRHTVRGLTSVEFLVSQKTRIGLFCLNPSRLSQHTAAFFPLSAGPSEGHDSWYANEIKLYTWLYQAPLQQWSASRAKYIICDRISWKKTSTLISDHCISFVNYLLRHVDGDPPPSHAMSLLFPSKGFHFARQTGPTARARHMHDPNRCAAS